MEWIKFMFSALIAGTIAIRGVKKNLTIDGGISCFVIGTILFYLNTSMGIMLIAFYYASSKLTHYKKEIKSKLEEFESQRNSIQVFCNSIWILLCALIDSFTNYNLQTSIGCLCILACCCGDTWASELGTVWASKPRLITTFKVVPPGTNGGISVGGSFASLLGGMFIGLNYYILSIYFNELHLLSFFSAIAIGSAAGFIGSMIDSLMGATIQVSLYCKKRKLIVKKPSVDTVVVSGLPFMNNEMVNLFSSLITGLLFVYFLA